MRARSIKPGLFKNETLGTADPLFTLIFEGLWCLADREGRLEDRPLRIHVEVNPYRDSASTVQALDWLVQHQFVLRYTVGGEKYLQVARFRAHQQPHVKEAPSKIPPPINQGDVEAPDKHGASTSLAALTPSSLTADSGLLTPDTDTRADARGVPRETRTAEEVWREANPEKASESDAVERVFEHWRLTHGHPKASLDKKRRKLIQAALKNYSEADLCQAITGYRNSPHHMGQNESGTVYDSIEVILRDAKHVDAGLKFYAVPPRTDLSERTRKNIAATEGWVPPELRHAAS